MKTVISGNCEKAVKWEKLYFQGGISCNYWQPSSSYSLLYYSIKCRTWLLFYKHSFEGFLLHCNELLGSTQSFLCSYQCENSEAIYLCILLLGLFYIQFILIQYSVKIMLLLKLRWFLIDYKDKMFSLPQKKIETNSKWWFGSKKLKCPLPFQMSEGDERHARVLKKCILFNKSSVMLKCNRLCTNTLLNVLHPHIGDDWKATRQ